MHHAKCTGALWQGGVIPLNMINAIPIRLQRALLALIAIALLSLPFAHRVGASPVTPEITLYLALGGNLSDICGDTDLHVASGCESCRIVSAMLLPDAAYSAQCLITLSHAYIAHNAVPSIIKPTRFASPPVRAPPAV